MSRSKRHRQSILIEEKNFAISTSAFIETPIASISQTIDERLNNLNHQDSSQTNQLIDWQEQPNASYREKSELLQDSFDISTKPNNKQTNANRTKIICNQIPSNSEDDWVCPVAVALRRAGYNLCIQQVPLRPSKSWLERDRKTQALLRQRPTSSKEM